MTVQSDLGGRSMTSATIWRKNSFLLPGSKLLRIRGTEVSTLCELRSQTIGFTEQVTAHLGGSSSKLGQLFHPEAREQCQSSAFSLWRKDRFQQELLGDLVTSLPRGAQGGFLELPLWVVTNRNDLISNLPPGFLSKVIWKGQWG